MLPAFWLTIQVRKRRVSIPFPLALPLILLIEILALLPASVYAVWKRNSFPLKVAIRFYLSRFILAFVLYGRGLRISVCKGDDRVQVAGRMAR